MSKKFKTEIPQHWLFDCITYKIMVINGGVRRGTHLYGTTYTGQHMPPTDVPDSIISSAINHFPIIHMK